MEEILSGLILQSDSFITSLNMAATDAGSICNTIAVHTDTIQETSCRCTQHFQKNSHYVLT